MLKEFLPPLEVSFYGLGLENKLKQITYIVWNVTIAIRYDVFFVNCFIHRCLKFHRYLMYMGHLLQVAIQVAGRQAVVLISFVLFYTVDFKHMPLL